MRHVGKSLAFSFAFYGSHAGSHHPYNGLSPYAITFSFVNALLLTYMTVDHWHDVLIGAAVGTLFSYFAYRQYYPSLASPTSHQPYSPRIVREVEEVLP